MQATSSIRKPGRAMRWLAAAICAAPFLSAAQAQENYYDDAYDSDQYFETNNFGEDEYGVFDEDFDWRTEDPWYNSWNDADRTAWNDTGESQWDVFGYDDTNEWGLFDW